MPTMPPPMTRTPAVIEAAPGESTGVRWALIAASIDGGSVLVQRHSAAEQQQESTSTPRKCPSFTQFLHFAQKLGRFCRQIPPQTRIEFANPLNQLDSSRRNKTGTVLEAAPLGAMRLRTGIAEGFRAGSGRPRARSGALKRQGEDRMRGIGRRVVARAGAALTLAAGALTALTAAALAQDEATAEAVEEVVATIDTGNTAWMLTSTALVLLMTIPGLALFYAGMVRKMNSLATMMQSFAITCLVTILWMIAGYSLAFGAGNWFIGDLGNFFLKNMGVGSISGTIPESVFMTFQMTFAIITPALITGAFADRMKFSGLLLFITLWLLLVYAPICHMVWTPNGLMWGWGVLDFAGGTVVHINAGIAGLIACIVLGKRTGYPRVPFQPHNLGLSLIGASLLWVGWFGFNAGSALSAGAGAGMAMAVTQIATAAAALAWMAAEWLTKGKPSILGIISGAVAGLVAITPASGFVLPSGALIIGLVAGVLCFVGSTMVKNALGYDDSLDVWGVHGIGGIVGAILTGVFATNAVTGAEGPVGLIDGNPGQIWVQIKGVVATLVYGGVASFILLMVVKAITGLRAGEDAEREGLDIALHGESVP
jgi:Amt family ammonium transporter